MLKSGFFIYFFICFIFFSCNNNQLKNGTYSIINKSSGKCLDLKADCQDKNGCIVQIWDIILNTNNQIWYIEKIGMENEYKIQSVSSNKILDAEQRTLNEDIGEVQVWEWLSRDNQIWSIEAAGNNYFYIIMNLADKYLSIPKSSDTNGTQVQLLDYDQTERDHQLWKFEKNEIQPAFQILE